MGPTRQISTRLSAYYAASFLIVGVKAPFWPVWLAGRGLGAREIATLFAAAIWVNVAATPAVGALADRLGRRRTVMIVLAGIAFVLFVRRRRNREPRAGELSGSASAEPSSTSEGTSGEAW